MKNAEGNPAAFFSAGRAQTGKRTSRINTGDSVRKTKMGQRKFQKKRKGKDY